MATVWRADAEKQCRALETPIEHASGGREAGTREEDTADGGAMAEQPDEQREDGVLTMALQQPSKRIDSVP